MIAAVVELLRAYGSFVVEFKYRYVSRQLKYKLELCWSILFHSITGCSMKTMVYMIERQVWNEVNIMLKLDDSYEKNLSELDLAPKDLFRRINPQGLKRKAGNYLEEIQIVYNNTKQFYMHYFPAEEMFPLLPEKAYYSLTKKWTIAFVK